MAPLSISKKEYEVEVVNIRREIAVMIRDPSSTGLISSPLEYKAVETIEPKVRPANTKEPRTPY